MQTYTDYPRMGHYDPSVTTSAGEMLMYSDGSAHYPLEEDTYELPSEGFVPTSEHFAEGYTNAEFQETHTILADGGDRFGVSAIAFDQQEELLWMGNQGGHVTSYYGQGLQKYTSFQVHANQEVRHIHTFEDGILALTQTALRCQIRRGIPVFTHSSDNMEEMQCQLQISRDTLLMGGHQDKVIEFNLSQGQETNLLHVGKNGCAILRLHPRFICAGDPTGRIDLRDPSTLKVEHTLEAHSGSLSDFDVHGNLLVTCGFSNRQGSLSVDRFLMVYDLRMMRAVTPIQVMLDPLLLRFMPSFSSRLVTVSALGQMQLVDTVALSQPNLCLYQVNTAGSMCLALDVSSSCQCMAFGDGGGSIHFYTSNPHRAMFNSFSRETEFADPVEPLPPISILDDVTPLSSVPLPYYQPGSMLLSDWPEQYLKKVYRRTPPIDPEILRTMKMQGTIGYAPNPMGHRRNQVAYKLQKHGGGHSQIKLFGNDSRTGKSGEEANFIAIPKRYRKIDVKYSKMGMNDFDFDQYNKTRFPGLEATLPNSYCNAMLQVLYYMSPVRSVLLSHLCHKEFCLACELGYLFHMLDISQGFPCQSSNFLRVFRTIPEASALGLILSDQNPESKKKANLIQLIQSWNRFILHQIHYEILETRKQKLLEQQRQNDLSQAADRDYFVYKEKDFPSILGDIHTRLVPKASVDSLAIHDADENISKKRMEGKTSSRREAEDEETEISRLFGMKKIHVHRCLKCGHEISKESIVLLCNLIYPDITSGKVEFSFCDVLLQSLCPEQTTPAWCDSCDKYQPTLQTRQLKVLPNILTMNCGLDNQQNKCFWQTQMDQVVQKVLNQTGIQGVSGPSGRPCRYGSNCSRPGCRFKHPGKTGENYTANTGLLYNTHSWLPMHIRIELLRKGGVNIRKIPPVDNEPPENVVMSEDVTQAISYDLAAIVCYIDYPHQHEGKNLVALINVGPSYHCRAMGSPVSQWYIFNDFSISPVPAQEVIWFSLDWKIPCALYWVNRDMPKNMIPPAHNPITIDVFLEDRCLALNNGARKMITFTPLAADEMPGQGDIVAMDAEFVTLNQEEAELHSDGKLSTIKPSHMSVARITCIRGYGPLEGTPFIDDYISTQEQVVDYLTQFSGIKPGDLDANFSSKHLTTLKATYQKLRFLVDNGVKFVGHGLKNDFRVINLVVPADQVIDTVLLFHLPHHRMVSLRFLAWHFLGLKIQSVTHDSIEDARTALQLYQRYQQVEAEGSVTATMKELYEAGKQLQWKVPGVDT
ncbi:PAB-dependent poly(A)-specific ribonuclease subunit PAN2 isoform X2 [Zootermopsis nevadensis]|uniref:PAB-dependent poly(A)-specific ribonuclease subunit PAN2 isoform X2 n=1 Tax=Zootermopsis nevadensis TaxID=136037 RepID=UPI000B8E46BA|nr:PAB-dependent poly(A)-specific ribonuclease subunit PAN2 isoform X2 [Zootermopsis nevadensis]